MSSQRTLSIIERMIILLGESASGKTEIAKYLSAHCGINKVITSTTRKPRGKETNGVDYFFLDKKEFLEEAKQNKFVEYTLYNNNYYGTRINQISPRKCVVLDPQGAFAFQNTNDASIVVFYLKAEEETRIKRMKERGDSKEEILARIQNDRIHFAKERMPKLNFVIETDKRSIQSIAEEIVEDYLKVLKKRNILV